MATLTAAGPQLEWETDPTQEDTHLRAAEAVFANQLVTYHGTNPQQIKQPDNDEAADFAGIALEDGAVGDLVLVRQSGSLKLTVAGTFAAASEGTAAYGDTSGTASNNPADITHTSTNNLPIGKVKRVVVAGAGATVVLKVEADGIR